MMPERNQIVQLIPPYNMPSLFRVTARKHFLSRQEDKNHFKTFGELGKNTGLSLTDLVTDPKRKIKQLKLRCVSTETVLEL